MPELSPELQEMVFGYATNAIGAIVLLIAVWIVGGISRRVVRRGLVRVKFDETLTKFLGNLARWAVIVMGALAALSIFGIQTTSFAAVLAGAGLAIGMAFSGTLGNFASGILLLTFRPFRVGQVVNVAGVVGKVEEIGIFTTTLDTADNRRFIVPNGAIFGTTIENISHHGERRVDVAVGTDYSADLDRTREVLDAAARSIPARLQDKAPAIVLSELGGSSVEWAVRIWVKAEDFWPVKDALTREVKIRLDEAGIGIPFPQMDVHLDRTDSSAV